MGLAFVYMLFYFILGHSYLVTERVRAWRVAAAARRRRAGAPRRACCRALTPRAARFAQPHLTVSTTLDNYNATDKQIQLAFQMGNLTAPDYCNMTSDVHWDFDTETVWFYPQCIAYLDIDEFTSVSPDEVWVYTNFWQRVKTRVCQQPPSTTNVSLPDPTDDAVNLILLGQNCTMDTTYYLNVFTFEPETITLSMKPTWGSSWETTGTFDQLTLMGQNGQVYGGAMSGDYTFWGNSADPSGKEGAEMFFSLADLLDAAGVDLDAQNVNSGGKGLETGFEPEGTNSNSATVWPSYRNTGIVLRAKLRVANYRAKQPVNFNITGELFVENASPGSWSSPPSEINYWGDADETYDCASIAHAACFARFAPCILTRVLLRRRSRFHGAEIPGCAHLVHRGGPGGHAGRADDGECADQHVCHRHHRRGGHRPDCAVHLGGVCHRQVRGRWRARRAGHAARKGGGT